MRAFLLCVMVLITLATLGCVSVAPEPARSSPSKLGTIDALIAAHNRERSRAGLTPLTSSSLLTQAAQRHAEDMAAHRRMSHRGSDGSLPSRRIERMDYEYQAMGENVAAGQPDVASVMNDWMHSRGHRRNILGKFTEIGAAYATDARGTPYWCVTFGTPMIH